MIHRSAGHPGIESADTDQRISVVRLASLCVIIAVLSGLWCFIDGRSPARALLAVAVGFVVAACGVATAWGKPHPSPRRLAVGMSVLLAAVILVPLFVGGRFPKQGGGGPAPTAFRAIALSVAVIGVGYGIFVWSFKRDSAKHRDDDRETPDARTR